MSEDWSAVAKAVNARAAELALKQRELATRSGVSLAIVRELQQGKIQRRRNPRTLEALSVALDWHPQHLNALLRGQEPPRLDPQDKPAEDPLVPLMNTLIREMRGIRAQLGAIAYRLDHGPPEKNRSD
ncbi:hypothetical protein KCV87_14040 [Actinosynnema pretiosum subsp. pretiosum]|uniref:Uncharacterized protein n=1 Tax=Actinosynnema pretiosum subsp. pretiosum TaxID=103721 RepID=A0AA45LBN5_9PSEU|nr:hypothetical protein KCV87_14040 [Actinosynnema pretiosum subsp. pretiosum]